MRGGKCEDALVVDFTRYYDVAGEALKGWVRGKDAGERRRDVLRTLVSEVQSPLQIPPLAELIASQDLSDEFMVEIVQLLSIGISRVPADPRAMSMVLHPRGGLASLLKLVISMTRDGIAPYSVISAIRQMMVAHYRSGVCAEDVGPRRAPEQGVPDSVLMFNRQLVPYVARSVKPISEEDIRADRLDILGRAEARRFWSTDKSRDLLSRVKDLRTRQRSGESESSGSSWRADLTALASEVDSWSYNRERDGTRSDYFHERAHLLRTFFVLSPPPQLKTRAFRRFVEFLEATSFQRESRIAWFLEAYALIRNPKKYAVDGDEVGVIVALAGSRDPVLSAYGRLAEIEATRKH